MAAFGVPEQDIARVIGIDGKTLRKHYREELDTGQTKATAKVAESLYKKATGDGPQSVTAAIFWLKTRARWKEAPQQHVHAAVIHDISAREKVTALIERMAATHTEQLIEHVAR